MAAETGETKTTPSRGDGAEERSPQEIEADIEATREELGDTVAELADKADVKKQAKRKVAEAKAKVTAKKDQAKETVTAQKEAVTEKVKQASPESAQDGATQATEAAQQFSSQAAQAARENPVATAAIGAFVGGVAIGWIVGRR